MSTYNGLLYDPIKWDEGSPYVSDNVDDGFLPNNIPEALFKTDATGTPAFGRNLIGNRTYVHQNPYSTDYNGFISPMFGASWYNKIHVIPNNIDLGNLVNRQERRIEVWNGYSVEKNLTAITPNNLDGTNLVGDAEYDYAALESKIYNLSVTLEGSPEFNGFYDFTFSNAEDPVLKIRGKRVVVMPWIHNWSEGITERISYLSDIIEAKSGKEQRIQVRGRCRRQLQYSILLRNPQERAKYHNIMAGWHHRTFAIGIWADIQPLGVDLTVGQSVIPVSTLYQDFEVGSYAMFWKDSNNLELIEIESITSTTLTLKQPLINGWTKDTLILPARLAYAGEEIFKMTGVTNSIETATQLWNILNREKTTNRVTPYAPTYTYKSYPVYTDHVHDWTEDPGTETYRPLRPVDFEVGNFTLDTRYSLNRERQSLRFLLKNKQEISKFQGFLDSRLGRQQPFWFPTNSPDMELIETIADAATSFNIKEVGYSTYIANHPARRNLAFIRRDGTMVFKKILNSGSNGDGTENITIDSPFGFVVTPNTFRYISYLRFVRLDSDVTEVAYETTQIAAIAATFTDLITSPS